MRISDWSSDVCSSDLHTARDGKPFAGGVSFYTPFGVMYSTNITPDPKTGIGQWSFDDFYQAMKHGMRPDGESLYPAFPYTSFAKQIGRASCRERVCQYV